LARTANDPVEKIMDHGCWIKVLSYKVHDRQGGDECGAMFASGALELAEYGVISPMERRGVRSSWG